MVFACCCFDCVLSCEVKCGMFHLWCHMDDQKGTDLEVMALGLGLLTLHLRWP